ncbi:MAG: hypothetical protein ACRDFS_02635 [Chloroflexota bacterium]
MPPRILVLPCNQGGIPLLAAVGARVYGEVTGTQAEAMVPDRRTELRDELTILIATGRELTPDHDQALADVFVDRLAKTQNRPPRVRHFAAALRVPRALLGAAILVLAVLGVGAAVSVVNTNVSGGTNGQARANVLVARKVARLVLANAAEERLIPLSKLAHAFAEPKGKPAP